MNQMVVPKPCKYNCAIQTNYSIMNDEVQEYLEQFFTSAFLVSFFDIGALLARLENYLLQQGIVTLIISVCDCHVTCNTVKACEYCLPLCYHSNQYRSWITACQDSGDQTVQKGGRPHRRISGWALQGFEPLSSPREVYWTQWIYNKMCSFIIFVTFSVCLYLPNSTKSAFQMFMRFYAAP